MQDFLGNPRLIIRLAVSVKGVDYSKGPLPVHAGTEDAHRIKTLMTYKQSFCPTHNITIESG